MLGGSPYPPMLLGLEKDSLDERFSAFSLFDFLGKRFPRFDEQFSAFALFDRLAYL